MLFAVGLLLEVLKGLVPSVTPEPKDPVVLCEVILAWSGSTQGPFPLPA